MACPQDLSFFKLPIHIQCETGYRSACWVLCGSGSNSRSRPATVKAFVLSADLFVGLLASTKLSLCSGTPSLVCDVEKWCISSH